METVERVRTQPARDEKIAPPTSTRSSSDTGPAPIPAA